MFLEKRKKYFVKNFLKEKDLLPEEVLIDSANVGLDKKLQIPLKSRNFFLIHLFLVFTLLLIFSKTFYLQIIKGDYYSSLAEKNKMNYTVLYASRGVIYDRNEVQLVQNIGSFDLVAIPSELNRDNLSQVLSNLSRTLLLNEDDLSKVFEKCAFDSNEIIVVKENLDLEEALAFEASSGNFSGFHLEQNIVRNYLDPLYFSHLIGYTGKVNKNDLEKNSSYTRNDYIGKMGVELSFESYLKGVNGKERHEVDSLGNLKRSVIAEEPQSGNNVVLTIDASLQRVLYDSLWKALEESKSKTGAAVAVDPRNGDILAMVSLPSFDNNLFADGVSVKDYSRLIYDDNTPLLNRAIAGEYPPGSTFKPLVASAMLQENVLNPNTYLNCPGSLPIVNKYDGSVTYKKDWKAHGLVNMYEAIAQSCNVYFYTVGGGYGDIEGLGIDKIKQYAEKFGFGSLLGIDLIGEKKGLIPDSGWKEDVKGEKWYNGDTYNISIGQGDLLATPLQIAMYISAIANGGTLWKPQIVDKIVNLHKNIVKQVQPEAIREGMVDVKNIIEVKKGMKAAVTRGSAIQLSDLPVDSGAKTGTAQVGANDKTHAWFTCFAPFENPEIAISVIIEEGGEGSRIALPVAKEVLKKYFSS